MAKKNNRRRSTGWARTKTYPHERHPATYRRKGVKSDEIEYITFTHSEVVDFRDKGKVRTVPLLDNISPEERKKNKNRSYAYPKVFVGKRSSLGSESTEFAPVEYDKKRIGKMFEVFPRENVSKTGGKSNYRKKKKPRK